MQDVYGKLEEPDGLGGLVRLRSGGPGLHDQILAAEKAGQWSEALSLYERALRLETHPVSGKSGLGSTSEAVCNTVLHQSAVFTCLQSVQSCNTVTSVSFA